MSAAIWILEQTWSQQSLTDGLVICNILLRVFRMFRRFCLLGQNLYVDIVAPFASNAARMFSALSSNQPTDLPIYLTHTNIAGVYTASHRYYHLSWAFLLYEPGKQFSRAAPNSSILAGVYVLQVLMWDRPALFVRQIPLVLSFPLMHTNKWPILKSVPYWQMRVSPIHSRLWFLMRTKSSSSHAWT